MHPLKKLYGYSLKYKKDIKRAVIYSLLNKSFDIMPELLIGVAVDVVVRKKDSFIASLGIVDVLTQIIVLGVITGLIWILESLFQYLYSLKWRNIAQNLQHDLRQDGYNHVQSLELAYFENKSTGNLMAILNDDINQLENFINDGANQILQVVFSSLIIGIIFFIIDFRLALLSFLPIPLIIYAAFYFQTKLSLKYRDARDKAGILNAKLNNNILGIATIKSYVAEEYELKEIERISNDYRQANSAAIKISSAITPIIRMAVMTGFLINLIYGGYLTVNHQLQIGSYSILIFLSQRLLWPLTYLALITDMYQRSMASINRVMDLLKTVIKIPYQGKSIDSTRGNIDFNHISFAYNHIPVLKNINLHITSGETIALVGSTGSGKSTLIKLLLRFYHDYTGQILLDGKDITQFDLKELRKLIGFVAQDVFLIDASIIDNIRYGTFAATEAEVIAAAKLAEAHDFISQLSTGYQTQVGERGQKLSGGQKQRLALARALLKKPMILILDEATSAVDNETEAAIKRSLEKIVKGRTTIIVAHRLSSVVNADWIYVIEDGSINEMGNHSQLIASSGIYAKLWALQTGA